MRDSAADGLSKLVVRPVWRASEAGARIADTLTQLLNDPSPLVRRGAAHGIGGLYAERSPAERVTAIADIARAEGDRRVLEVLLWWLQWDVAQAPAEVDDLLRRLDSRGGAATEDSDSISKSLLAYLAVVPRTPFASARMAGWFSDATEHHETIVGLAPHLRDFLNLPDGSGQAAAFELLDVAARAARDQWHAAQAVADGIELREAAARVAHAISQEIYFASGAFDDLGPDPRPPRGDSTRFATYALPVLQALGQVDFPASTHEVVQTLIHLAPVSERQMLVAAANAVPPRGAYPTDSLAAGAVLPYLHRLLIEQRDLVLHDAEDWPHSGICYRLSPPQATRKPSRSPITSPTYSDSRGPVSAGLTSEDAVSAFVSTSNGRDGRFSGPARHRMTSPLRGGRHTTGHRQTGRTAGASDSPLYHSVWGVGSESNVVRPTLNWLTTSRAICRATSRSSSSWAGVVSSARTGVSGRTGRAHSTGSRLPMCPPMLHWVRATSGRATSARIRSARSP